MIFRASTRARPSRAVTLFALCAWLCAGVARAQVAGEQVLHGNANFERSGSTTTITAANNTIIRYSSFDIAAGQTVQFIQPSRDSRVLNWINGSLPTNINGALLANGQVYIANAAGVYFGAGSYVNAGSLYVAGGSISNDDFLRGSNHFTHLTGNVRNDGKIEAGNVALIGRLVANHGSIYAPQGFVSLVSGDEVQLSEPGSAIVVSATDSKHGAPVGVENTGRIDATSGHALLAAGDLYSVAISQSGTVRAGRITVDSGATGTTKISGTLDARSAAAGGKGGEIAVLGQQVQISGSATLDASGRGGGGTVLVGGDTQGKNSSFRNASSTTVDQGALIAADALQHGDGGKVIVWSDGYTGFAGSLSARGGDSTGAGGFAEISGKTHLDLFGLADLRAPAGHVGTLLLDPSDITLVAGVQNPLADGAFSGTPLTYGAGNHNSSTIYIGTGASDSNTTLLKLLAGADVVVTTVSAGRGTGDITIQNPISYASTHSLTFNAGHDIIVTQAVTNSSAGSLVFVAGNAITLSDNVSTAGDASFSYAGQLTGTGRISAVNLTLLGGGTATSLSTTIGSLILSKSGGSTTVTDTGGVSVSGKAGSNLSLAADSIVVGNALSASGNISFDATRTIGLNHPVSSSTATFNHNGTLSGSGLVTANSLTLAGSGAVSDITTALGTLGLNKSGGDTSVTNTGPLTLFGNTSADLTVSTSGSVTQSGLLSVGGNTAVTLTGQAYDVSLGLYANVFTGNVSFGGASGGSLHDLSLRNAATTTGTLSIPDSLNNLNIKYDALSPNLGRLTSVNDLTLNAPSFALPTNTLAVGGNLSITSGAITGHNRLNVTGFTTLSGTTLTLDNALNSFGKDVSISSGTAVTLRSSHGLSFGSSTINGPLNVETNGNITQSGALNLSGTTTFILHAAATDVTLGSSSNIFANTVSVTTSGPGSLHDFTLANTAATTLALPALAGDLSITSAGIAQAGLLDVTGVSTFNVTGSSATIDFSGYDNQFRSDLTFGSSGGGSISNLYLRDVSNAARTLVYPTSLHDLTLSLPNRTFSLPALNLSGNLSVAWSGSVSQTGALQVSGSSAFTASGTNADLLLGTVGNAFTGPISISASRGGSLRNVTLTNDNTIAFNIPSLSGDLNLTSMSGDITENGMLQVTGTASFTSQKNGGSISVASFDNVFGNSISFSAGSGGPLNDVSLRDVSNSAQTLLLPAALRNLTLDFPNRAVVLPGSLALTGNLVVGSGGAITQAGSLSVSGTTHLTANASATDVTLNNSLNSLAGTLTIDSVGAGTLRTVTLSDTAGLTLDLASITNDLSVTSGGTISQNRLLDVGHSAQFTLNGSGTSLNLGSFDNLFGSSLSVSTTSLLPLGDIGLRNISAVPTTLTLPGASTLHNLTLDFPHLGLALPALTLTGNLSVTAGQAITQTGPLSVLGSTTFTTVPTADISLPNASNNFQNTVAVTSSQDVTLRDLDTIQLGDITSRNLTIRAGQSITQANATRLSVSGLISLIAGLDIDLDNVSNDFGRIVISLDPVSLGASRDVTLRTVQGLSFEGPSYIAGKLAVTTRGDITQTSTLSVGTTASFTTNNNDVALNGANTFSDAVSMTSVHNASLRNATATLLGGSNLSGTLQVQSGGSITQTGALDVLGAATFTLLAGPADITLANGSNTFNSGVTLAQSSSGLLRNISLGSDAAIALTSAPISGTLSLAAGGAVTQVGSLQVGGTSNVSVTGAAADVTLNDPNNIFNTLLTVSGSIRDLSLLNTTGTALSLPGPLRNLTLVLPGSGFALPTLSLSGDLSVTAHGNISQSGNLNVAGDSHFVVTSAGASVTLGGANHFGGSDTLSIQTSGVGASLSNVTLADDSAVDLQLAAMSGNLSVTSHGDITQSAALNVGGNSQFTVTGTSNNVVLSNANNVFSGALAASATGVGASLQDFSLTNTAASVQSLDFPTALRNLTLQFPNRGVALPGLTLTGNLSVTAGGTISQTGMLDVTGLSTLTLNAANSSVLLGTAANRFVGAVQVATSGSGSVNDFQLSDTTAVDLDLPTLLGSLTIASGGAITQSQVLTVAGTSSFSLTSGTADITLSNALNSLSGALTIANAGGAVRDLTLANANATASTLVLPASLHNITLTLPNRAVALPGLAATGSFTLEAGGSVSQLGALDVTGAASFTLAPGSDLNLENAANTFSGSLSVANASVGTLHNVTINDDDASLALDVAPLSGDLTVSTGGSLSQLQTLQVGGNTSLTFTGAASDVSLITSTNRFDGTVTVATSGLGSLRNFALTDTNDLALPAMTLSGNLAITSGGSVSQVGKLSVLGSSTFTATGLNADVVLNDANNLLQGAFTLGVSGGSIHDFALANSSPLAQPLSFPTTLHNLTLALPNRAVVLPALTISGALDLTFGGALSQTGALVVSGNSLLTTTAANVDVDLSQTANAFGGTLKLNQSGLGSVHDFSLVDTDSVALDLASVLGNLSVVAGGDITQSSVLSVGGTATLRSTAVNADVTLSNPANFFADSVSISGSGPFGSVRNVSLTTSAPLTLGSVTLLGDLAISSGSLNQTGALDVAGNSHFTLTTANADLLLGNGLNRFVGGVAIDTSGAGSVRNVTLSDSTDLALPRLTLSGDLSVTSAGTVTQTGSLIVAGGSSFQLTGTSQDLLLGDLGNQFVGTLGITGTSGAIRNLTLADSTALTLQLPRVTGNLLVTSGGDLTQAAALQVDGTSRFVQTSPGADVTLNQAANLFAGTVQIATSGSGSIRNLSIVDTDALSLDFPAVSGNLSVTAGSIAESSPLVVSGAAQFGVTGSLADIDLSLNNTLGSAITIASLASGSVRDVFLTDLGQTFATLAFPATLRNLSLHFPNLPISLPSLQLSGNLGVISGGAISQVAASTLLVSGTTSLTTADSGDIDLRGVTNDFQGTVSILQARDIRLLDATALVLGNVAARDLNIRVGLGLSQAPATSLNLTGLLSVSSSAGSDIALDSAGNSFSAIDLALDPDTLAAARNVTLRTTGALTLAGGASVVGGNLAITAAGAITQKAPLRVAGTSIFEAHNHNLTLFDAGNDFVGAVSIASAHDAALRDANGLTLGPSTLTGSLHLAASSLDLSDNLAAAGITLDAETTLSLVGAQAIDAGAQALVVNGNLTKTAPGRLSLSGSLIDLNGSVVAPSGLTFNGPALLAGNLTSLGITLSTLTLDGGNQSLDALAGVLTVNGILSKTTSGSLNLRGSLLDFRSDLTAPGALLLDGPTDARGNIAAQGVTLLHDLRLLGPVTQSIDSGSGTLISDAAQITKANGSIVLAGASGQLGSITASADIADNLFITSLKGTWTAARITFSHDFSIAGDTTFNSAVNLGSGLDMNGHSLTFGGDVALTRDATLLTGGGQLTFKGTVDGPSAFTIDTGTGGTVSVLGDMGARSALARIVTTGEGTLRLGANVTTNGNSQLYGTVVVLAGNVILTELDPTGSILFSRTLDALTPASALVIDSPGTVKFAGSVGSIGVLGSLTTDPGGTTIIAGGSVSTRGAQDYGDSVQLSAATTIDSGGGKVDFAKLDGGHQNLTLAPGVGGGDITFRGTVNDLGSGSGAALTLSDTLTGVVDFQSTLNANSGIVGRGGNTVQFAGNVTLANGDTGTHLDGEVRLGNTTFTGYDGIEFGRVFLTGSNAKVNALDSAHLRFDGTIDGPGRLAVSGFGTKTFAGDLGGTDALAALDVSGGGATVVNGSIHTAGDQIFHDGLTLSGTSPQAFQSDSGRISSAGAIQNDGANGVTLRALSGIEIEGDLNSRGAVTMDSADTRLSGDAAVQGLTLTRGLTLTGLAAQNISVGEGTLTAASITKPSGGLSLSGRNAALGGNVGTTGADLTIDFSNVNLVSDISIATANGKLALAGTFTGAKALRLDSGSGAIAVAGALGTSENPLASLVADGASVAVNDVITTGDQTYVYDLGHILLLNGDTYTAAKGNINLNTTSTLRTEIPAVATIVKPNAGDIRLTAGGNIAMGLYEKFSVTKGALTFHAGGTAILSDLSVAGNLQVEAANLRLLTRKPGSVRIEGGGETQDLGLDFVAQSIQFANLDSTAPINGGAIDFTHDSGQRNFYVRFATADGSATVPLLPGFSFYTLPASYSEGGQISQLEFGPLDNVYLDLRAIGFNRANVGSALPPVAPPQPIRTNARVEVPAALREDLVKLGIFARPDTDLILKPADSHAPIYDAVIKSEERSPEQFRVADNRISADEALATIRLYRMAFEKRRPDGSIQSRVGEIQLLFTRAFEQYEKATGKRDPRGFRRYLETQGGPALDHLNHLRSLLVQIGRLGLTEEEFSISKTYVLRSIRVPGLPLHALREAIEADSPPSAGKYLTSLDSALRRAAP